MPEQMVDLAALRGARTIGPNCLGKSMRAYDAARTAVVRRILRLDPLGIRRLLPSWIVTHVALCTTD